MTPLEVAAKALWDAREDMQHPRCRMKWEDGSHLARLTAVNEARAVLVAVQDMPMSIVEVAAIQVYGPNPLPHEVMNFEGGWVAMIAALLADPPA